MIMEFKEWLEQEMDQRGYSQATLSRKVGVTSPHINHILHGRRNPGIELCEGIARAFKMPPEEVLRVAGLLPQKSPNSQLIERIYYKLSLLDDAEKLTAERYLDFLIEETDRAKNKKVGRD